jgi:AcrR family transcriptional regulator
MATARGTHVNTSVSTKERILGAAELLFAQRGFDGASLRQLTAAAGVNLAAVNYHFGSKDKLVEQVFRHRLDALNERRLTALAKVAGAAGTTLEDVLDAYIRPALDLSHDDNGALFMRVLARAYAEHDDRLRQFLSTHYGHVMRQFTAEFARLLPDLG